MEDIKNLTKEQLITLQVSVENRLRKLEEERVDEVIRKNSVKNKTKLSQLTHHDRVLGIRFAWDKKYGKHLKTVDTKWSVDVVGYCDVTGFENKTRRGTNLHRLSISHKTEPFGISTSLEDEEVNKRYLLFIDTSSTGYGGFFTLSPETWKEDIMEAIKDNLKRRNKYHDIDCKKLKEKVKLVLDNAEKINDYITKIS